MNPSSTPSFLRACRGRVPRRLVLCSSSPITTRAPFNTERQLLQCQRLTTLERRALHFSTSSAAWNSPAVPSTENASQSPSTPSAKPDDGGTDLESTSEEQSLVHRKREKQDTKAKPMETTTTTTPTPSAQPKSRGTQLHWKGEEQDFVRTDGKPRKFYGFEDFLNQVERIREILVARFESREWRADYRQRLKEGESTPGPKRVAPEIDVSEVEVWLGQIQKRAWEAEAVPVVPYRAWKGKKDKAFIANSKRIVGTVTRTGTMRKTVRVSRNVQVWDVQLQKYYTRAAHALVHDPDDLLVEGDVVSYVPGFPPSIARDRKEKGRPLAVRGKVSFTVVDVLTPFGQSVRDRLAARSPPRAEKAEADEGVEEADETLTGDVAAEGKHAQVMAAIRRSLSTHQGPRPVTLADRAKRSISLHFDEPRSKTARLIDSRYGTKGLLLYLPEAKHPTMKLSVTE